MKLNKKGFTLIELIIAIVLMLSLTILVVVGFTKISDEKKKEADKLTEKQIETAAEQFFSSNYFYVDYMKENPGINKIFINLGTLVTDDYLNVTTKTSTEEKYDSCDIVYATYNNSKVKLNYLAYTDIVETDKDGNKNYNKATAEKLGYPIENFDKDRVNYENYLLQLGILKESKEKCSPVITAASDIIISQRVDQEYIESNGINTAVINSVNWYNDNIPILITIAVSDLNEEKKNDKNKIADNTVIISKNDNVIPETSSEKTLVDGSHEWLKKYRIFVNSNGLNKLKVDASTFGGKTAFSEAKYYIDKKAPVVQMGLYKTNSGNIPNTIPSISSMSDNDYVSNNTWINNSGKKNAYFIVESNDKNDSLKISGIDKERSYCKAVNHTNEADDEKTSFENNSDNTIIEKYNMVYFYDNDKVSTYECEFFDKVGNSSGKHSYTIKRDITPPEITINDKSSKLKVSLADNQSGVKSATAYKNKTNLNQSTATGNTYKWNGNKYPEGTSETINGNSYEFNYANSGYRLLTINSCDNAGNCGLKEEKGFKDSTKPNCTLAISGKTGIITYNTKNRDYTVSKQNSTNPNSWFVNDVKVYFESKEDSGSKIIEYGLSTSTSKTYNNKTEGVQNTDTAGTTWYGYVKDEGGNEGSCQITVKRDTTAPRTTKHIYGSSTYKEIADWPTNNPISDNTWTNKYIKVVYDITDDYNKVYYGLNRTGAGSNYDSISRGGKLNVKMQSRLKAEGKSEYTVHVCDAVGNCKTETSTVKLDRTKPICSLSSSGKYKTIENDYNGGPAKEGYKFKVKEHNGSNYGGWYTSNVKLSLSRSDSLSGVLHYAISANNVDITKTPIKKWNGSASLDITSDTASKKYYGYIEDKAGNQNKCQITIKRDTTPPSITSSAAGKVKCKAVNSGGSNSWGYAVKFKDNLSGAVMRVSRYYSSISCDSFYWADSNLRATSSGNSTKSYTAFARCSNNSSPKMRFVLVDYAGNIANSGNEIELTASKSKSNSSTATCDSSKYYEFK